MGSRYSSQIIHIHIHLALDRGSYHYGELNLVLPPNHQGQSEAQ